MFDFSRKTRTTMSDSGSMPELTGYIFATVVGFIVCDVIVGKLTSSSDMYVVFAWIHYVMLFCLFRYIIC